MMAILSVGLLLFAGVALVIGLAVRFSGRHPVLSGVDATRITDMAALNRYAGHRLLLVPLVAFPLGIAGLERPLVGLFGGFVVALVLIGVVIWIAVGIERFRAPR
jgi:hypothetical protein